MVSEKVGGAEGTKLDDDFRDLERVREASLCVLKRETSSAKALGLICFTHSKQTNCCFCGTAALDVYTSFKATHRPLTSKFMKPF